MASGNEIVSSSHDTSNQAVCAVESKSKPKPATTSVLTWLGTKAYTVLAAPATGPVIVVCVCLAAFAYNKNNARAAAKLAKAKKERQQLTRSVSIATLHGGKMALERLLDAHEARIDATSLESAVDEMKRLLADQSVGFRDLQRAAAKLEMSGREDEAIKMLTEAHANAQKNNLLLEAYELEMILVEMFIYKGALDRALQCKCLQESSISDARIPLYKAIIYTMKDDKTRERKYYEEFQKMRMSFLAPDETEEESVALFKIVVQFEEFERVVEHLKKEIEHAHEIRAK